MFGSLLKAAVCVAADVVTMTDKKKSYTEEILEKAKDDAVDPNSLSYHWNTSSCGTRALLSEA